MKLDTKLHEKDIDIVIERKKRCILVFEYIKKNFDRFCYNFDKY